MVGDFDALANGDVVASFVVPVAAGTADCPDRSASANGDGLVATLACGLGGAGHVVIISWFRGAVKRIVEEINSDNHTKRSPDHSP